MPTQRPQLVNGEIFHVILRAVGDTKILFSEKVIVGIAGSDLARILQGPTLQTNVYILKRAKIKLVLLFFINSRHFILKGSSSLF